MHLRPSKEYTTLMVGDVATFCIALWVTLAARTISVPTIEFYWIHLVPFSILFVAWVFVFFMAGLYARYTRIMRERLPHTIFYAQLLNVVIAATFFFLIPYFGIAPKTILVIYLIISSLLIGLWRLTLFPLIRPKERQGAIILGAGEEIAEMEKEINNDPQYPFTIIRSLDTEHAQVHETVQQICRFIEEEEVSVIIADTAHPALEATLPIMYDAAFRKRDFLFLDTALLYESLFSRVPINLLNYHWVLGYVYAGDGYAVAKRMIDIVSATLLLIPYLLVLPFVWLAIKMEDGGPLFITQERVGLFQKTIRIRKFRSMTGNDGGNYGSKGTTDLKVTRVGAFLRYTRIDELPQLLNVLLGDLSFVGPRPELPSLAQHYSARIPFYNARHLVKPGLTGWAQIRHDTHPHHGTDVVETKNKLSYDLYYLRHRSLFLDVYIMLQTARVVLFERGS